MKRKWLIGLLSVFMVLAMCFGVVACGGDTEKDEETAQTIINQLNSLYQKENKDTPDDFQRLAQVKIEDTTYPVEWSANVKTQGYDNCVKVGTEKNASGMITIDVTRVTVDVEYTLTATVKVNDVTKSASYEHKIPKKSAENSNTATLDFSEPSNRTQFDVNNNLQVWSSNGITLTNTGSVGNYTKPVRLYKNTTVTIEMEGSNIIHIDFHSSQGYDDNPYPDYLKTSLEASDLPIKGEISVSEDGLTFGVDFETPMESVTFKTTAGQCRLTSIDVEGVVRTHTHHWTYEHIAGTWTHTATCTAEGCDVGTRTENCTPVLNECACGYTYTAKEIVDALYALQTGKSLPGTYTLTGKVTDVTELDTNKYYNVTFKMTVEGKELTVYRAKGDQYAEIAVGGTATVNGELLDYSGTKEFTQGGTIVSFTPGVDDRTPQQKVTAALAKVNVEYTVNAAGNYTLPTPTVDGVTFSWAKKSGNYELSADGKSLVIGTELPAEAADAVLTLTASYGSETLTDNTKDVTFHIKAKSTTPTPTGDFVLNGEGLATALNGAKGYQTGTYTVNGVSVELDTVMPNDAFYNGTSSYPYGFNVMQLKASAGTIKVTGTFTALTIVVVSGYDYSDSSLVVTAGTTQLTVKDHTEADANFAVGDQAWKAYTINYDVTGSGEQTISIKAGQYAVYVKSISLTGTAGSGSQGGGSQGGGGSETPTGTFTPLTEAKTGTFKFALYYGTDKSYYYATGAMSGYYFATSTNLSEAADFVIESVGENQYTIKVGGKYLEFAPRTGKNSKDETKNNEGVNIEMNATQTEGKYWQWVEGIQNFVMESTYNKTGDESATDLYYFGNYGTYTSMSGNFIGRIATGSDGSYTPNDTEGVSQWVAHFGTLENSSTKPETAQDKVDKALAAVEDSYTVDKAGDYMLPAAPEGLTFTWAKTSGDFTLTNGNALSIGAELPDEAKIVVLTLTVTCGDEAVTNNTKTVTIHINAKSTTPVEPQTETTVDFSIAKYATKNSWDGDEQWTELPVDKNIDVNITATGNSGKYYSDGWRIYQTESPKIKVTAKNSATIVSIAFTYTSNASGVLCNSAATTEYSSGNVIDVNAADVTFTVKQLSTYSGNDAGKGQIRVTAIKVIYKGGLAVTDQEKVDAVYEDLVIEATELTTSITLPESTVDGVTIEWTAENAENAAVVSGNELQVTRSSKDVEFTLKAKIKSGEVTREKTFTLKVLKEITIDPNSEKSYTLDLVTNFGTGYGSTAWKSGYSAHTVGLKSILTDSPAGNLLFSEANKQTGTITDRPVVAPSNTKQYVTLELTEANTFVKAIEFELKGWSNKKTFKDIHIEYLVGTTWTKCSADWTAGSTVDTNGKTIVSTTIPNEVVQVRLVVDSTGIEGRQQVGFTSIKLTTVSAQA